jgi:uncharacterized delta-60 repeat protein
VGGGVYSNINGSSFLLIRINKDGSFDKSFGDGGIVETSFKPSPMLYFYDNLYDIKIESNGKILAAGSSVDVNLQFMLSAARYNSNGSLDATFGTKGKLVLPLNAYHFSIANVFIASDHFYALGNIPYYGTASAIAAVPYSGQEVNQRCDIVAAPDNPTLKALGSLHLNAMPNPSTSYFTLILNSPHEGKVNLIVSDGLGRVIEVKSVAANSPIQTGGNYRPGIYYVQAIQGGDKVTLKLIKQ